MKKIILTSLTCLFVSMISYAQTIASARAATVGSNVTIRGIVLNGPELGSIRYVQDPTGGISIYGTSLSAVHRGDSIIANGTLTSYNNLFEITPVTFTVLAINKPLPAPAILAPNAMNETYEGQLVQISNATFALGGGNFAGNTNYNITASTQTTQVRVATTTTLVGAVIPNTPVNVYGICSQFCSAPASGCTTGYQLLLRDDNDIVNNSSIYITTQVTNTNINTTSFDLSWSTNIAGSNSYIKISKDQYMATGVYTVAANSTTTHSATILSLTPATVYYAKVYSINGSDTASSSIKAYCTKSNSTGTIKTYFNRTVDNTVSTSGVFAIYLNGLVDDTLIAYINRAKSELEIAIYNWDSSTGITAAVNAAAARGVKVRIVGDGSTAQSGMGALSTACKKVSSPQGANYTIMHNKFVIIDANSPANAIVWTGSTNWTSQQLSTDANNVIIFQDQSLAQGYKVEFDEMWGDTSVTSNPNASIARFGQFKKDNTPHEYIIGGKRIEQYFSPSDNTNSKLLSTIGTANTEMYTSNLLITRTDLAQKIASQTTANGLTSKVLLDDTTGYGTQFNYIKNGVGTGNAVVDCHTWLLHHKYLIVDQTNFTSDPLVETGSHNWSVSGDTKNDENIVIVHDQIIANVYFQEFNQRWTERNCAAGINEFNSSNFGLIIFPNPATNKVTLHYNLTTAYDKISFSLIDYTGRELSSKITNGIIGSNTLSLSLEGYASGIYFIEMNVGNQKEVKKIIVN